jgi:hypothetical protein
MSQQNLEILSDERIAPSLLESEYPELIASVDSIAVENSIPVQYSLDLENSLESEDYIPVQYSLDLENSLESEDFLDSGYSLDSEISLESEDSFVSANPIFFQEIEVDSLTGVPTDPTAYARVNRTRRTTALRNPGLDITTFSYSNQALVTATVKVELSPIVKFFIEEELIDITLQGSVWGMDGGFFGNGNDRLFNFSDKIITGEGNYTFSTFVDRRVLNEDRSWFNNTDEIAAKFSLTSSDPAVPVNLTAWTNIVTGRY